MGRYAHYGIRLRPWLWFLTRTSDCHIFQTMTVPNIIKEVGAFGVKRIGQFKFVLRFMKVKKVAVKMTDNLMVLYRTCELDVRDVGEKKMKISVIGFPDDIVYCKLLEGGIEQLFEYLNVSSYDIDANHTTYKENISSCNYVISWT